MSISNRGSGKKRSAGTQQDVKPKRKRCRPSKSLLPNADNKKSVVVKCLSEHADFTGLAAALKRELGCPKKCKLIQSSRKLGNNKTMVVLKSKQHAASILRIQRFTLNGQLMIVGKVNAKLLAATSPVSQAPESRKVDSPSVNPHGEKIADCHSPRADDSDQSVSDEENCAKPRRVSLPPLGPNKLPCLVTPPTNPELAKVKHEITMIPKLGREVSVDLEMATKEDGLESNFILEKEAWESEKSRLENEIKLQREELESLKSKQNSMESHKSEQEERISALTNENSKAQFELDHLRSQLDAAIRAKQNSEEEARKRLEDQERFHAREIANIVSKNPTHFTKNVRAVEAREKALNHIILSLKKELETSQAECKAKAMMLVISQHEVSKLSQDLETSREESSRFGGNVTVSEMEKTRDQLKRAMEAIDGYIIPAQNFVSERAAGLEAKALLEKEQAIRKEVESKICHLEKFKSETQAKTEKLLSKLNLERMARLEGEHRLNEVLKTMKDLQSRLQELELSKSTAQAKLKDEVRVRKKCESRIHELEESKSKAQAKLNEELSNRRIMKTLVSEIDTILCQD